MKKILFVGAAALMLAACQNSQTDRALVGGGLGAATGAAVGAVATGNAGGAVVGGIIGGAGGAAVGAATTPKNCIAYDQNGVAYRVACP